MNSFRKHHPKLTATILRLGCAALRRLVPAAMLPLLTACGAPEPQPRGPAHLTSAPASEEHASIGNLEITGPDAASAKLEIERMMKVMRETRSQGCDSPVLLPLGTCEGPGTCETFPLEAYATKTSFRVGLDSSGDLLSDSGVELTIDVIQCKPGPSVVMTYSQDIHKSVLEPAQFSAPTELKGKYFLRLGTNKVVPGLQINAGYQVFPDQSERSEGPCSDPPPGAPP